MPYTDKFTATDDLITHLNASVVGVVTDAATLANYAGFLSVSVVTVYELAIKEIFGDFSAAKATSFGVFIGNYFKQINGRIKLDALKGHVKQFGERYLNRFNVKLDAKESAVLAASHVSMKAFYSNVITCRHNYVHVGTPTLTIAEVIDHYNVGKNVIECLFDTMKR